MPWLVVAIIAAGLGGVMAVVAFNGPTGPIEPTSSTPAAVPIPVRVERDAQWTQTGVSCITGDTFSLTAKGELDLDGEDPTPPVGPTGSDGTEPGLQTKYRSGSLHAGALYVGDASLKDGTPGATIERYTMFNADGTAEYTCDEPHDLWLLIDDSNTTDNDGGYDVEILPRPRAG